MPDVACMAFQLIVLVVAIRVHASTMEHALNATMDTPAIAVGVHLKDLFALMVRTCLLLLFYDFLS